MIEEWEETQNISTLTQKRFDLNQWQELFAVTNDREQLSANLMI